MTEAPSTRIPCPFIYANGRECTGHIVRVEAYKADVIWMAEQTGRWSFGCRLRSHFHLFCSEKGNHAGFRRNDPAAMKFWYNQLPEALQRLLDSTAPQLG